jgi:hypothetical protein
MSKVRRKKVTKGNWVEINKLAVPVNTCESSGVYVDIVRSFKYQLDLMQSHHRKVLVIPYSINFMEGTHLDSEKLEKLTKIYLSGKSELMSKFTAALKRFLTKQQQSKKQTKERSGKINKNQTRVAFTWVREQTSDADKQHYHLFLIIDGSKVQFPFWLNQCLSSIAKKVNLGIYQVRGSSHNLNRKDISSYLNCLHHFSYLAKEASKKSYNRALTANDYSSSKLKPPEKLRWQGFTEGTFKAALPLSIDRFHYKERLNKYPLCN